MREVLHGALCGALTCANGVILVRLHMDVWWREALRRRSWN